MDRTIENPLRVLGAGVILVISLAVVAGGATWQGSAGDAWVILPGIVLLAATAFLHLARPRVDWIPLVLVASTLLLPVLQTLPWPGDRPPWSTVHAAWQLDQARVFGIAPPTALSVAPDATWRSFLAMLPPAAVFLAMLLLPGAALRQIVAVVVGLALLSAAWVLPRSRSGTRRSRGCMALRAGRPRASFRTATTLLP